MAEDQQDPGANDVMPQVGLDPFQTQFQANPGIPPELYAILFRNHATTKNGSQPNEFTARGAWTQQEDEQLMAAVSQLGPKKWIDIAKFVPTRTSKQCRERWHHRLDPQIKHEPFEPWEDRVIIEKQQEIGNRWSVIAQQLPGRSASAIKNRWYSGLRSHHPTHAQMDLMGMQTSTIQVDESGNIVGTINPPPTDL